MKYTLTIQADGAAFGEPGEHMTRQGEVARILRRAAGLLDNFDYSAEQLPLMDLNGNRVGQLTLTED